tara:strand:+ start:611 stop:937 length:327 start_codon:yes stop_codon:yes gene_type:complete
MAQLYSKVKLYLEANSKTWQEEEDNIILQNDGSGDYIHTWNVSGLAKPTDEQLTPYDAAGDTAEANGRVNKTRRKKYGNWQNQLDEIYHDIDAWKARIQQIKSENPKT